MKKLIDNESYYDEQFNKLNLTNTSFHYIEFEQCEFVECDFSSAQFSNCKFIDCQFQQCNLSLVQFPYSRLFELSFQHSKLVGVDWTKAHWPSFHADSSLQFKQCILNDSSFFGLTLQELKMTNCKLHDVDFREGDFAYSEFIECDFQYSLFMRTNLQSVDFTDSYQFHIDPLNNMIKKAKFCRLEALNLLESLGIELID